MKRMLSVLRSKSDVTPALLALLFLPLIACDGDSPSEPDGIALSATAPVEAFEGSSVDCAEFPVTVRDLGDRGGEVDYVELSVIRPTDGTVLGTNRRPNLDFRLPDQELPSGGTVVVEAGLCWEPEPAGTPLDAHVEVQVSIPTIRRATLDLPVAGPRG